MDNISNPDTEQTIKYIAQYLTSDQYTPDDWKSCAPAMMCTDETTIGEIREWMASRHGASEKEFKVITLE